MKPCFSKRLWLVLIFLACLPLAAVQAAVISYEVQDLALTSLDGNSGDVWQYTYHVSDLYADTEVGFTIFFDYTLFGHVEEFNDMISDNGDWTQLSWDPDPSLPDDGAYDALSLVENASLADPFTVSFIWLGAEGAFPGSQRFEIYEFNPIDFSVATLDSGNTAPVPEPGTMLLLATGLMALTGLARRRK